MCCGLEALPAPGAVCVCVCVCVRACTCVHKCVYLRGVEVGGEFGIGVLNQPRDQCLSAA